MADFTQSLASTINFFGIEQSTKWGSPMKWGTDKWGNGLNNGNFDMPARVMSFNNDTSLTFSSNANAAIFLGLFSFNNDSATFIQNAINESLSDGSGKYLLVLSGGATNDENAFVPAYVVQSNTNSTWTLASSGAVSWVTA